MTDSGLNFNGLSSPNAILSSDVGNQETGSGTRCSGAADQGRSHFQTLNDNGPLEPCLVLTPSTPPTTPQLVPTPSTPPTTPRMNARSSPNVQPVDAHVQIITEDTTSALYSPPQDSTHYPDLTFYSSPPKRNLNGNSDKVYLEPTARVFSFPFGSPQLNSNPSTPPISLPITPPAITTIYGAIAMSMPNNSKSHNGDTYHRVEDIDSDEVENQDYTRIEVPEDQPMSEASSQRRRKDKDNDKFPSEKKKTLIALIWFAACLMITCLFITLAHDRYPKYETNRPLPDIVLENVSVQEWAFPASEYCAMFLTVVWYSLVLVHRHKWILLRRQFFLMGLLYLYRCVTMYVTNLPRAYDTYECASRTNGTFQEVVQRSIRIMLSGGMSVADELHTCGDWVFSGHTCVLVMTFLFIQEYSPRRLWILHWGCGITAFTGVVFILLGHDHYTLDCVLAYYFCTRVFWMYHTMAVATSVQNNKRLPPSRNDYNFQLNRVGWFRIFDYFECNVKDVVPRQYGWPLPWPRHWASKHKEFD